MRLTRRPRSIGPLLSALALSGLVLSAALTGASCSQKGTPGATGPSPEPAPGTPRLVLFLVVDQLRADYLERFRPLFTGGLHRLLEESLVFTDTHHGHASTTTAPGHASLATGAHPARHGIISNYWYDRASGDMVASDEDDRWDEERSPHRLLLPTLSDRMKERWPESRVFGASGKSRGAILPVGRRADRAFWIDSEIGRFVTSTYYGSEPPAWLAEFHASALPDRLFGTAWEPLPAVLEIGGEYRVERLDRGLGHPQFPHPIGRASVYPDESYYWDFHGTPFTDRYLLELARKLIVEERLGEDVYPDFLALSFSALDYVGHAWGPDSPEVLDTLLRLDRTLGELLDFVDARVGLDHTLVSLSADHGVVPVPEVSLARGREARRFGLDERLCMQGVNGRLSGELGEAEWFEHDFVLDREVVREMGTTVEAVAAAAARWIDRCPGVERVWTAAELAASDPAAGDPESLDPESLEMLRLHRNSYHPERSPDLLVQFEAWSVPRTSATTTHGSPYAYDTRVPWLLRVPAAAPREVGERALTVDVAPTLAALLGLDPGADLDGRDLSAGGNTIPP